MILTGDEIVRQRDLGNITIDPFDEKMVQPNSYDLTLGRSVLIYDEALLSVKRKSKLKEFVIPSVHSDHGFVLYPGQLYLAHTVERCGSDHYVCCLDGKSSLGRLGLQVHLTAGFGDLGFSDSWTLEMTPVKPVEIFSGIPICQAVFYSVVGEKSRLYKGKYKGQTGPRESLLYTDLERRN